VNAELREHALAADQVGQPPGQEEQSSERN
jgi:hypothetical protein